MNSTRIPSVWSYLKSCREGHPEAITEPGNKLITRAPQVQAVQLAALGKAARRIQVGFPGLVVNLRDEEFERALRRGPRRRI